MFDSKNVHRPASPKKVLWFEFLLNPTILEKHLSEINTDPSPTDLIIKFLSNSCNLNGSEQSNNSSGIPVAPPFGNGVDEHSLDNESSKTNKEDKESKKKLALKLLALKVAAFLKWDLNIFEKKFALVMQQALLTELLKVTGGDKGINEPVEENVTPDAQFAQILYHTWVLRAVIEGSYPAKNHKGLNIQLPGVVDPSVIPPPLIESIMRKLSEESEKACASLENVLMNEINVRMPLINCFDALTEDCPNPDHKWDHGLLLKPEDVICQGARVYWNQMSGNQECGHMHHRNLSTWKCPTDTELFLLSLNAAQMPE